jgi:septum formation topological specificity factor MinE
MTHKTNISIVAKYVDLDTSCIVVAMDNTSSNVCHIDLDFLVILLFTFGDV